VVDLTAIAIALIGVCPGDQGIISPQERGRLIEKATALYAQAIKGIGEGT
jgi:hypothetical protein